MGQSLSVGGEDEDSGSLVGSADVGRTKHSPFRIEPEFGQSAEYVGKSSINENRDVLHEDVVGFNFANDA